VKLSVYNFWWLNLREKDHMANIGLDGRIILRCIFTESECGDIVCIDLAQDRDGCRALVNTLMKIGVLEKQEIS
jgi:hypothetical protein